MQLTLRPYRAEIDQDYFVQTEFAAALESGMIPPGRSQAEQFANHRQELLGFVADAPCTGLFIAECDSIGAADIVGADDRRKRVGLLWVSERETGEPWDLAGPIAWIYDIRVAPNARRNGLGLRFLAQADAWARAQGYRSIGLHVFAANTAARALYAKAGYVSTNTYLQKDGLEEIALRNRPADDRVVHETASSAAVLDYVYDRFRIAARATADATESSIRDRYEAFVQAYRTAERDDVIYAVSESDNRQVLGLAWAYASRGDLGKDSYVWLRDLITAPGLQDGIPELLLGRVSQWAVNRKLDAIRTWVHSSEASLHDALRSLGFRETNIFLRKTVSR